jgi:hypothetical protein
MGYGDPIQVSADDALEDKSVELQRALTAVMETADGIANTEGPNR